MKILHIVDTFDTKFERDQVVIVKMCNNSGFDTSVLSSKLDSDGNFLSDQYLAEIDHALEPVKIIRPFSFKITLPGFHHMICFFPSAVLLKKFDVVHVYTVGSFSSILAFFCSFLKRNKIVLRVEMSDRLFNRITKNWLIRLLCIQIINRADLIYTFTRHEQESIRRLGFMDKTIKIIPPGIDFDKFSIVTHFTYPIIIGYFGRFDPLKGPHHLIDPLNRLSSEFPDIKIKFAGPFTNQEYGEKIIQDLKKLKKFEYCGIVKNSSDFYKEINILLFPVSSSWVETGAIVVLEAMAAGKVVIAYNNAPVNEYIEDRISGFLVKNEEEIYQNCRQLIQHPEILSVISDNAKMRARNYNISEMFKKINQLYKNCVDND